MLILSIVIELAVVALISILADRVFSTKGVVIALCVCLPVLGFLQRGELKALFSLKSPSATNSPPPLVVPPAPLPTSKPLQPSKPPQPKSPQIAGQKSLKQRTDQLGIEIREWLNDKERAAPGMYVVEPGMSQRVIDDQQERQDRYWEQTANEFIDKFGPGVVDMRSKLERCHADTSDLNNALRVMEQSANVNQGLIFTISNRLRAVALNLPDTDAELDCSQH